MRLRRAERVEHNRERLLEAARRVFLSRGYAGATLEAIAEDAGFSKGVVYSQFQSKADLFLALLERRIEERAERNRGIFAGEITQERIAEAVALEEKLFLAEPEWTLLLVEFRVHAARDATLARRYGELHARTVSRLAELFAASHAKAGREPPFPPSTMAELVLAFAIGLRLERAANPDSLPMEAITRVLETVVGVPRPVPAPRRSARTPTKGRRR